MQNVGGGQASVVEPMRWQFRLPEWCLVASLVSLSPLVAVHAMHLWERPHFQFFPLAWIAFGLLVYQRARLAWYENSWRGRLGIATWVLGLLIAVGAAYLFSPWLGMLSAILCLAGWGFVRLGDVPAPRWFAWLSLLVVTLPLPGSMDAQLISRLQALSSQSAGALLDLFGLLYLRQGNLIEIGAKELFVDEACSGIDSFYALIAIALLMMVWQKRPLIVSVLTLLTVPVWAWFGNVVRLVLIVWLLDKFDLDLSHGWKHTVLGLLTFAIASAGLFATLDSASQLFKRFSSSTMPRDRKAYHLAYNAIVCYPGRAPKLVDEEQKYFESEFESEKGLKKIIPSATEASQNAVPTKLPWKNYFPAMVVLVAMVTLGLCVKAFVTPNQVGFALPHYDKSLVDSSFSQSAIPEVLLDAKQVAYRGQERSPDNFYGEYSRIWLYKDPVHTFTLSADFPFRGYHPLWFCYTSAGQVIDESAVYFKLLQCDTAIARVKFRDDLGAPSYLWFINFDAQGQPVVAQEYDANAATVLEDRLRPIISTVQDQPLTYQFQLYIQPGRDLTSDELDKYYKIFLEALPYAVNQVQQLNAK